MAEFGFNEVQLMFQDKARDFATRVLAPGAKERVKQNRYPKEIVKRMGEEGFQGLWIPEQYGGQPGDAVMMGITAEEFGKVDHAATLFPLLAFGIAVMLGQCHPDAQKEWLPRVVRGEVVPCFSLSEPECGSDATALKTRAKRDGDFYVLSGEKTSITLGTEANLAGLFATVDPSKKARGITCFVVPLDLPGVSKIPFADTGWISLERSSVFLDDVRVPAKYRAGEEGGGFLFALEDFNVFRVMLALSALGMAETSLDEAFTYAKERRAWGRPILKFEGVSFRLVENLTKVEAARLLCYKALWLHDQGMPFAKESAMCKYLGPVVALDAIHSAYLTFGHVGYSAEYPIEQRLRDCLGYEFADGSADIMKLNVLRHVAGTQFLPYT
jgi:cyclohexanecarboxyl-CoA dehydrogenase